MILFTDEHIYSMILQTAKMNGEEYMNEIAVVTEQDIPDILRMIHEIYSELPNKEWFSRWIAMRK